MRVIRVLLATCLFLLVGHVLSAVAQPGATGEVPQAATIEVALITAPSSSVSPTKWDMAYEFRIATEADVWNASRRGNFNETSERAGELIKKGSLAQTINSPKDRMLTLRIPFDKQARERLKNQPKTRLTLTGKNAAPETLKLIKEQERLSHVFMLYSIVNVHDGNLNKTIVIPISRGWDYSNHPNVRFSITIEVKDDNTFSWKSK